MFERRCLVSGRRVPPVGLSRRARVFWADYHDAAEADGRAPSALEVALLVEAVRLMTRADELNEELLASGVADRRAVLVEARLTATAVKGVVAELRQHQPALVAPLPGSGPVDEEDPLDELGARRKDRLSGSSGQ